MRPASILHHRAASSKASCGALVKKDPARRIMFVAYFGVNFTQLLGQRERRWICKQIHYFKGGVASVREMDVQSHQVQ